ncbi:MAG: hypothetical protein WAN10_04950, partial [Candidatus Acidiferrales bacterium]
IYAFAHQAYWGFRFLSKERNPLWQKVILAKEVREVQGVGEECSRPHAMAGAGYGAAGLMTWLKDQNVALQVLAAKKHRRYPRSERPSSRDRRMFFLAVAVGAGVWEINLSTALRKLAEAGLGQKHMADDVHRYDRIEETLRLNARVWAEPVGNYFLPMPDGTVRSIKNLPCDIPENFQGGYIIHGFGPTGLVSAFSRTLPLELRDVAAAKSSTETVEKNEVPRPEGDKIEK